MEPRLLYHFLPIQQILCKIQATQIGLFKVFWQRRVSPPRLNMYSNLESEKCASTSERLSLADTLCQSSATVDGGTAVKSPAAR